MDSDKKPLKSNVNLNPKAQDSILEIFNDEFSELAREWLYWMVIWEKDYSHAPLKEMRRILHTLKGSAHMMKFRQLADDCHQLEEVLLRLDEANRDLPSIENQQLIQACQVALSQASKTVFKPIKLELHHSHSNKVSFEYLIPSLEKTVSQLAQELEKEVRFQITELSGEMDRNILERLIVPLGHLLSNAIDHGIESPQERLSKGKPHHGLIQLSLVCDTNWMNITVRDDGAGLDAKKIREKAILLGYIDSSLKSKKYNRVLSNQEIYSTILIPGFSTSDTVTQISGRGIGMDVVNNEVKKLGGSLLIDSIPDRETIFSIKLPIKLSLEPLGFNILVIDDSRVARKQIRLYLEKNGYNITEAQEGMTALEVMKNVMPSLVLLDIEMPKMGGLDVIKKMRSDPLLSHIPIVVITSVCDNQSKQAVLAAGANIFLNKPVSESILIRIIQDLLL